jgi:hypothetical protein
MIIDDMDLGYLTVELITIAGAAANRHAAGSAALRPRGRQGGLREFPALCGGGRLGVISAVRVPVLLAGALAE